jgi:hypothetical protein
MSEDKPSELTGWSAECMAGCSLLYLADSSLQDGFCTRPRVGLLGLVATDFAAAGV